MTIATSASSLDICGHGHARSPYTVKRTPARFIGSSASTVPCSAAKPGSASRRRSCLTIAASSLPDGRFNGVNVPCAHQSFGGDFGNTYWAYYDGNGSLKYDAPTRPGKDHQPSSLDFYSDVIGKMTGVEGNKGNVLRFFLFFDGRSAPTFDTSVDKRDSVIGLSAEFQEDFFLLCELAKSTGVTLIPVLWSFEALEKKKEAGLGRTQSQGNHKYLFEATKGSGSAACCDAFVGVLKPFVAECERRYPGLVLAWDIFNEPEWGMDPCPDHTHTINGIEIDWVSTEGMQTFVAKCAVGIHEAGSRATLGSASMRFNWERVDAHTPDRSIALWSDKAFENLTHDNSKAYLDFYQIHYYPTLDQPTPNCYNPSIVKVTDFVASGKTVLVGEVPAYATQVADAQSMIDNGYYGVLFWAYEGGEYGRWDGIYQAAGNGKTGFNKFPKVKTPVHSTS